MLELSACIEWLFSEAGDDFEPRIRAAHAAGIPAVEFWGWRNRDIERIARVLGETGLEVAAFAVDPAVPLADPSAGDAVVAAVAESADAAARLACRNLIVVSGDRDERLPAAAQRAAMVAALRRAAPVAAARGVTLLLEPLNTRVDHVGTFLDSTEDGFAVVDEVGTSNVKLLFDLYHAVVMGERMQDVLGSRLSDVGHIHVADAPGRHEPGTGAIDWPATFGWLAEHGYHGRIGLEYEPVASTDETLAALRRILPAGSRAPGA
jgi:hydroxypyruvate isomerase